MKRKYGWKKDKVDNRDYLYKILKPLAIEVPDKIDLRPFCSDVENQESLGSCTANAITGNLEFLDKLPDNNYIDVSRLFIYYNTRALEGTVDTDSGSAIRDGIKTLASLGYCSESLWNYDISKFAQRPSEECYIEAQNHKIVSYYSMTTLNEMLTCLADGYPFVFGISIYESFESKKTTREGIVKMPDSGFIGFIKHLFGRGEKYLGGHAIMAVGYDRKKKQFLCRNSWGKDWGQQGYFVIPFKYLETLANDFWTIRK